jgi:glycosyltransferase involved in cell wall biosynthesis
MTKKIVFVNQSTGYLTIDIINSFARHFDEVHLIYGNIRVQDIPLHSKVTYSKIVEKSRSSHVTRFLAWFVASIQVFWLLLFRYRKHEIFYVSLPPFAYLGSLFLRNKFSLLMFDVYPDVLKMIKIGSRNPIYWLWAKCNRSLFAKAHRVYTIGDSLADLMAQYVAREKIHVVPLWTGLTNVHPIPKDQNPFIKEHGLTGKFIVQYSGNIGGTHNIETLIEAAKILREHFDILFLIIGRGLKVPLVKQLIEKYQLENCLVLPFQPDEVIRYSIAAADISVVLIEDQIANVSIPSKVYNIMAVGSGLLSISPKNSEIDKLITKHGIGVNFSKEQVQEIAEHILQVKHSQELQQKFSDQAVLASEQYTMANADKYLQIYLSAERPG